ncbi:universal stress protein [Streptomyces sp. cg40]|uniref:universal stress protein n=1 Tax=Streptomyces sp. cg40 TaxID=3419764 RepID=UPI003D00448C
MLPPVIAGVDGSAESLAAAGWAAREAVRRDLPLRLVHVWNWHPRQEEGEPVTAAMGVPPTPLRQWGRQRARHVLRQAKERARAVAPGLHLCDEQVEGPATAALLKAAGESELLVLGSRGLSGFTGFLVGSVAQGVVARATRPVVLVRADEIPADEHLPAGNGSASVLTGYRDVVLGVDLGDPCDAVIEFAFEAARLRGARLRAVHAWQPPSPLGLGPGEIGLLDGARRAGEWHGFLSAVLQVWRDKYPGVEVAETVTEGRAQSVLLRAASGAGLLVVGRHLTDRPAGPRIGPVTHTAIHHVGCPVAVVPHE